MSHAQSQSLSQGGGAVRDACSAPRSLLFWSCAVIFQNSVLRLPRRPFDSLSANASTLWRREESEKVSSSPRARRSFNGCSARESPPPPSPSYHSFSAAPSLPPSPPARPLLPSPPAPLSVLSRPKSPVRPRPRPSASAEACIFIGAFIGRSSHLEWNAVIRSLMDPVVYSLASCEHVCPNETY